MEDRRHTNWINLLVSEAHMSKQQEVGPAAALKCLTSIAIEVGRGARGGGPNRAIPIARWLPVDLEPVGLLQKGTQLYKAVGTTMPRCHCLSRASRNSCPLATTLLFFLLKQMAMAATVRMQWAPGPES